MMHNKQTLAVYNQHRRNVGVVECYDNSMGSRLLFEARAGALQIVYRKRYSLTMTELNCCACGNEEEIIEHILKCKRCNKQNTEH